MGRVTGIEILNLIRKKHPTVRSILISGTNRQSSERDGSRINRDKVEVDMYLHKPVRSAALRDAVESLLASKDVKWQDWAKKVKTARESKP